MLPKKMKVLNIKENPEKIIFWLQLVFGMVQRFCILEDDLSIP